MASTGSRLFFWLHPATSALSVSGYWSGVVNAFSIRTPSTRDSADVSWIIARGVYPRQSEVHVHPAEGAMRFPKISWGLRAPRDTLARHFKGGMAGRRSGEALSSLRARVSAGR